MPDQPEPGDGRDRGPVFAALVFLGRLELDQRLAEDDLEREWVAALATGQALDVPGATIAMGHWGDDAERMAELVERRAARAAFPTREWWLL